MLKGRLASMTKQLLLFRTLLMIVSVVIISLVIYTFTMEKIRSIAVMKLIGAPNQVIVRLVMEQSLLLTVRGVWLRPAPHQPDVSKLPPDHPAGCRAMNSSPSSSCSSAASWQAFWDSGRP